MNPLAALRAWLCRRGWRHTWRHTGGYTLVGRVERCADCDLARARMFGGWAYAWPGGLWLDRPGPRGGGA